VPGVAISTAGYRFNSFSLSRSKIKTIWIFVTCDMLHLLSNISWNTFYFWQWQSNITNSFAVEFSENDLTWNRCIAEYPDLYLACICTYKQSFPIQKFHSFTIILTEFNFRILALSRVLFLMFSFVCHFLIDSSRQSVWTRVVAVVHLVQLRDTRYLHVSKSRSGRTYEAGEMLPAVHGEGIQERDAGEHLSGDS